MAITQGFNPTISTELGVTVFQIAAGLAGGIAAIVAARRLSRVSGTIQLSSLALPILIAGGSTIVGAYLIPA